MKKFACFPILVIFLLSFLVACVEPSPLESETTILSSIPKSTSSSASAETTETSAPTETASEEKIIPLRVNPNEPLPVPYYKEISSYMYVDASGQSKFAVLYQVYNSGSVPIVVYPYEFHLKATEDNETFYTSSIHSFIPSYIFGGETGYVSVETEMLLYPEHEDDIQYSCTIAWKKAELPAVRYPIGKSLMKPVYYESGAFKGVSLQIVLENAPPPNLLQVNMTLFDKEGTPLGTFFSYAKAPSVTSCELKTFFPVPRNAIPLEEIASYEVVISNLCEEVVPPSS